MLCLAGAGGLQAPILACAGAEVTVIDISNKMLDKDREIAKEENLEINIVKGNMCDLTMFSEGFFDLIINPLSLMYVPELSRVFNECYRVLDKGEWYEEKNNYNKQNTSFILDTFARDSTFFYVFVK